MEKLKEESHIVLVRDGGRELSGETAVEGDVKRFRLDLRHQRGKSPNPTRIKTLAIAFTTSDVSLLAFK